MTAGAASGGTPRLLAAGRDADVLEHGPGLVLRRMRRGESQAREAQVLAHARAHGLPVPAVHELRADGAELVMERVAGPTMLDDLQARPWRVRAHARTLARLHERVHAVPAPEGLPEAPGGGSALLHLDLHPLNVLLAPGGAVLIDWANARRGRPGLDVAMTWVVLATAAPVGGRAVQAVVRLVRGRLLADFLAAVDRPAAVEALPDAAARRLADPNVPVVERAAVRALLAGRGRRRGLIRYQPEAGSSSQPPASPSPRQYTR